MKIYKRGTTLLSEAKAEMEKLDKIVDSVVFVMDSLKEMEMGIELYNLDEAEAIPATA